MRLATAAFVVVCSAVCAPSVRAQATVTFNHRAASADALTDVIAERVFKPGTDFIVNILETCPGAFTYTVRALRRETPPPVGSRPFESGGPGPAPLEQKTIGPIRYDDQYGGYIIDVHKSTEGADCAEYFVKGEKTPAVPQPRQVTRVAVNPDDANSPTKLMEGAKEYESRRVELKDRTFTVSILADQWGLEVAGGFAVTSPADPEFGLVAIPNETGKFNLKRDDEARAHAGVGATTFIQVAKPRARWGWAFGIGVGGNGATSYMAGPMFRFGDVASIVFGAALTPRLVRPANVTETTVVDDPGIVNTLPRKPRAAVFVGVSFAFLGAQDKFKKPLGIDQPAAGAAPDPDR